MFDRLRNLWTEFTYCRRYGHYEYEEGRCLHCGKRVKQHGTDL